MPVAFEDAIAAEVNLLRSDPAGYCKYVRAAFPKKKFSGVLFELKPNYNLRTKEGWPCVLETLNFLKKAKALPKLSVSAGLCLAARDHCLDQGPTGKTGHASTDGSSPFDRMKAHGQWGGSAAENIDYGHDDAREIVLALLIDDGVPSRGHRSNLFSASCRRIGAACAPHKHYKWMCTMDFAGSYTEKEGNEALADKLGMMVEQGAVPTPSPKPAPAATVGGGGGGASSRPAESKKPVRRPTKKTTAKLPPGSVSLSSSKQFKELSAAAMMPASFLSKYAAMVAGALATPDGQASVELKPGSMTLTVVKGCCKQTAKATWSCCPAAGASTSSGPATEVKSVAEAERVLEGVPAGVRSWACGQVKKTLAVVGTRVFILLKKGQCVVKSQKGGGSRTATMNW